MGYVQHPCGCGWMSVGGYSQWSCLYHQYNCTPEPGRAYSKPAQKQIRRWVRANRRRLLA